jgi:hypothetical protein
MTSTAVSRASRATLVAALWRERKVGAAVKVWVMASVIGTVRLTPWVWSVEIWISEGREWGRNGVRTEFVDGILVDGRGDRHELLVGVVELRYRVDGRAVMVVLGVDGLRTSCLSRCSSLLEYPRIDSERRSGVLGLLLSLVLGGGDE